MSWVAIGHTYSIGRMAAPFTGYRDLIPVRSAKA